MAPPAGRKVYMVGVGMTHFDKPGRQSKDYPEYGLEAMTKALVDANLTFDDVAFAAAGYVYGESTSGQRVIYQLGTTGIPIVNVNNNCSTGSSALWLARQAVAGGMAECALAVGFEKMNPGSLGAVFPDRTNPNDLLLNRMSDACGFAAAPPAAQFFGNAGMEYLREHGGDPACLDRIAEKSHAHSTLNPYSQFNKRYTLAQVHDARRVFGAMTLLHCSPTSDGAAAVIVASEAFVRAHHLGAQAVEMVAHTMATDARAPFHGDRHVAQEVAGMGMTRRAAQAAFAQAGITPADVGVVELHDCFSCNELITYDALGLCAPGAAAAFVLSGAATLPAFRPAGARPAASVIVNPSGGLISKGHPLGATGLAQAAELTWQLRGWAGPRQVPQLRYALQHNIGLGGACVVGIYRAARDQFPPSRHLDETHAALYAPKSTSSSSSSSDGAVDSQEVMASKL
ncbi:hypothetical protein CXG81DRAFT_29696 [Caulochytrium protostelioides]|uniref:propanoyl-CoA C-acyltransferase n=1 Tax=Caulochytrium protostelioides TaxID=1555241 RepID=A0A4P9X8U1_9FUNG|nr:hypothetical protein CXG81DRAFT_29696 [Caulochytrium protostelioides]|eukprot:RKP01685.1 hypothetical protein CXG81DRAFT_29696 [Caulochytrium protostelioides]